MLARLHLLSQDEPAEGGLRGPYLRMWVRWSTDPQVFDRVQRQGEDLEAPWRDPDAEGAHGTHLYCALTSMT